MVTWLEPSTFVAEIINMLLLSLLRHILDFVIRYVCLSNDNKTTR